MRTVFDNPLYDPKYPETGVPPPDADGPSKLPPEHPDFEPDEYCPPKVLFPEAHRRAARRKLRRVVRSDDSAVEVVEDRTEEAESSSGKGKEKATEAVDFNAGAKRRRPRVDVFAGKLL